MELVKGQDDRRHHAQAHRALHAARGAIRTATRPSAILYRGSIAVDGADSFERRWLVTVRREPEGWRVTNYQELEP